MMLLIKINLDVQRVVRNESSTHTTNLEKLILQYFTDRKRTRVIDKEFLRFSTGTHIRFELGTRVSCIFFETELRMKL